MPITIIGKGANERLVTWESVSKRLSSLRIEHHMTMEQVAKEIGVSKVSVSRWERQERCPKIEHLYAYSDYFNVSIDWICYGDLDQYILSYIEGIETNRLYGDPSLLSEEKEKEIEEEISRIYPELVKTSKILADMWNDHGRYPKDEEIEALISRVSIKYGIKDELKKQVTTLKDWTYKNYTDKSFNLTIAQKQALEEYEHKINELERSAEAILKLLD